MNREDLIKFIPQPKNEDVIIYDTSLKDLLEVNVFEEYSKLLPIYNSIIQQYKECKNAINNYEQTINNVYLFKHNWSEEDYLFNLQNEKKTYAILFGPIKKMETNIEVLQKKLKLANERIETQIARENKAFETKKENIENEINKDLDRVLDLKDCRTNFKINLSVIDSNIVKNQKEFTELQEIVEGISTGECKCQYCGSKLSNVGPNSLFYKRISRDIKENKLELEKLFKAKQELEAKIEEYNEEIKDLNQKIKNNMNFKKDNTNNYKKKSIEVLRLEANKNEILNEIEEKQKEFDNNSQTKSKKFTELKNLIEKYEISLDNLKKVKQVKLELNKKIEELNDIKNKVIEHKQTMEKYKKFISIYFKIYEQKATEFCGKDFKFKVFDFEDFKLIEKFEIYYKTIKYENLSINVKSFVDGVLASKFYFSE